MTSIRIAAVQAHPNVDEPVQNVTQAVKYLERAAGQGAQIVCLPETFPGPWTETDRYDARPALTAAARDLGLFVIAGTIEPAPGKPGRHHNTLILITPDGTELGRYRRTTPPGPWIYRGGSFWDFDYEAADTLPVFNLGECTVGLLVCSEVYVPELARELALKGAEIIFMPAGLWKRAQWETWRVLTRARAIENLAYTVTCQNILGHESEHAGLAMVCSPEEIVAESAAEGVLIADCDLDRIRFLREQEDGPSFPSQKSCKAGVLWQWYRPELYSSRLLAITTEGTNG